MPGIESETLNPVLIAQIASRLFNELPEAGSVPKYETDAAGAPSSLQESISDKTVLAGEPGRVNFPTDLQQQNFPLESGLPYVSETVPAQPEHDFYFLPGKPEKKEDPLGHHANKLTEQQNYSENTNGSYGLDQFIRRTLPPTPESSEIFSGNNQENITPFFTALNGGLPTEDDFSFKVLLAAAQDPTEVTGAHPEIIPQTPFPEAFSANQLQEQLCHHAATEKLPQDSGCPAPVQRFYRAFQHSTVLPQACRMNPATVAAVPSTDWVKKLQGYASQGLFQDGFLV